tara:strand:- start:554 stop:808 length:255 start_codon:yes stop_codon:yes gene_type:complete
MSDRIVGAAGSFGGAGNVGACGPPDLLNKLQPRVNINAKAAICLIPTFHHRIRAQARDYSSATVNKIMRRRRVIITLGQFEILR